MHILSENLFPVIGVGASAGGLEAFKELVRAIPEDSGMAYILVQHLAPQHESMLTDILQKSTNIPVLEITDSIKVESDHIYIIPSNRLLTANDGILQLEPLVKGEKLNTIDVFFTSLAEIHQQYAIGIIFSGTGSDGTIGLKTIKDQGGTTIVQDENSAAYYAMPQSAIDAEVVDFVLSPGEIPGYLKELVLDFKIIPSDFNALEELKEEEVFKQILALLKAKRSLDFTYYKQSTIRRRILRRKALNRIEKLKDYKDYLFENKSEQDALFKDILIPVTAFFRDTKSFTVLCETIFPVLFMEKTAADPIRIWVAGCSTGEEAYSMAICLQEYYSDKTPVGSIQIFATDVSEASIAKARSGIYHKRDMAGISEARLKHFFTKTDGSYQVNKIIREMCVFACQNFLKDPPFAKMDLISCRNVLIYMEPYIQKNALTTFHYALNNNGVLFLGRSESIGQLSQQFEILSQQDKFYKRNSSSGKHMPVATERIETALKRKDNNLKHAEEKNDFQKAADEVLLAKYATSGVIVNEQLEIIQFRGSTGAYLEAPPGKASHNILKMAREGLAFELRSALHKAKSGDEPVKKEGIPVDKGKRKVDIEVTRLHKTIELYFLVVFTESTEQVVTRTKKSKNKQNANEEANLNHELIRIEQLEKELAQSREDMSAITENQEAANEELQSANEELLSGSEELQSLNEELQTTKEEIQSSNEELTILNQELIERNEQLIHSRKYADAIITTIHEPILVLTQDFYIKSANKSFYEMFKMNEKQTEGKLFFEYGGGVWDMPCMRERLQTILPGQNYFEGLDVNINLPLIGERILELNARQLLNDNSNEQLILVAMQDITERKELEKTQKLFAQELERQVHEQTKELKEANINLERANENLQQFASVASHDLQEPLRKIKTFTAILNKNHLKNPQNEEKEIIDKITSAVDRMSLLIREVLEYSKVTRKSREFEQTNLDIILKNVISDLDLLISENGATINYEKPLPVADVFPLQMNQLFTNLLTNSLKFIKETTTPVVTISHRMLSAGEIEEIPILREGHDYVEILFSDNGIGFEQQFAEQIFQIFERLHSSYEFDGTGIGLALCKKIVENHNGYIFAESKENEGASFYIILPIKQ